VVAAVNLDQYLQTSPAVRVGCQDPGGLDRVDSNAQQASLHERAQAVTPLTVDPERVGDKDISDATGHEYLGLRHSRHSEASRPRLELTQSDLATLVRLCVRPEKEASFSSQHRHIGDIAVEDVSIYR